MCLLKKYGKYATMFISCPKSAIPVHREIKQIDKYQSSLKSLFCSTTAQYLLSVYIDVSNACSPNFLRRILTLSNEYVDSSTAEVTLALSMKNQSVLSVLPEFKMYSVNRIYLKPVCFDSKTNTENLLHNFEQIAQNYENLSVELPYDPSTNLWSDKSLMFLTSLQDCGIKHVTLEESGVEKTVAQNMQSTMFFRHSNEKGYFKSYDQYLYLQELLERLGFQQYEFCNFSIPNFKSVQNTCLWTGKQFIGVGPNAYSRITNYANTPFERQSVVCLNTDTNSEYILQKRNLSKCEVLEEMLYLGLRTTPGIKNSLWKLASGNNSLHSDFGDNDEVQYLIKHRFLQITNNAMWLPKSKLVVLNSVLVTLFKCLHKIY